MRRQRHRQRGYESPYPLLHSPSLLVYGQTELLWETSTSENPYSSLLISKCVCRFFGFYETSKALYTDTRELLARYGVYRTEVAHISSGKYIRPRWQYLVSDNCLTRVQNLELDIALATRYNWPASPDYRHSEESTLQQILDLMDRPLNCYVKLVLNGRNLMRWEEIAGLNPLRRFKTVTVEVGYSWWLCKAYYYANDHPS